MNVLLTGSSGWLSRHLAKRLREAGHRVVGIDLVPGPETDVLGSIVDREFVDRRFSETSFDAVMHTATLHKPDIARHSAQRFLDVNVSGTLNLLEASVRHGVGRFVFTSTTSLMISAEIRRGETAEAVWMDRDFGPLQPRNIYGVTKLAAEGLCRMHYAKHGLPCTVLRTSRFFPEEDDMGPAAEMPPLNLKAVELLARRLTVEDAAGAHMAALARTPELGFQVYVVSSTPPFAREDARELKRDAPSVVQRYFPDAAELFARRGWRLPQSIGRVYDPVHMHEELGFRCATGFETVLNALRTGAELPLAHLPDHVTGTPADALTE